MVNGADHLLCLDSVPVEVSGRLQVLETGDLLIAAVRESDAGRYSCVKAKTRPVKCRRLPLRPWYVNKLTY